MFAVTDTFFVADCHLQGSRPELSALFLKFLNAIEGAGQLWILGDFVEYWLGDDAGNPELDSVFDALAARITSGTRVDFMHGNRDFLLGSGFGTRLGATVHTEDQINTTLPNGEVVLLMHGDTLCTDDAQYQKFRTTLRSSQWQTTFLSKDIAERVETAKQLRQISQDASAEKSQDIMDVNPDVVAEVLRSTNMSTLVHGHTHRPKRHEHIIDTQQGEQTCQRLVLGDWHDEHAVVAHASTTGLELMQFPSQFPSQLP